MKTPRRFDVLPVILQNVRKAKVLKAAVRAQIVAVIPAVLAIVIATVTAIRQHRRRREV